MIEIIVRSFALRDFEPEQLVCRYGGVLASVEEYREAWYAGLTSGRYVAKVDDDSYVHAPGLAQLRHLMSTARESALPPQWHFVCFRFLPEEATPMKRRELQLRLHSEHR